VLSLSLEHLAANVRVLRLQAGLTQSQLAERLPDSWNQGLVSRIECGHRRISTPQLKDLARALKVTLRRLLAHPRVSCPPPTRARSIKRTGTRVLRGEDSLFSLIPTTNAEPGA